VLAAESSTRAQELWLATNGKAAQQVTHINEAWNRIPTVAMEIFRYSSLDGLEIEAGLLKPAGFKAEKRHLLVAAVHGGPSAHWADRMESWGQLLAARGFAAVALARISQQVS